MEMYCCDEFFARTDLFFYCSADDVSPMAHHFVLVQEDIDCHVRDCLLFLLDYHRLREVAEPCRFVRCEDFTTG